jgi:hypothetical protein
MLKQEFERAGLLQRLLLRYTQALMTQMSQTAACNRHHSVEQQLCRWLLLTLDRMPTNELVMTQELVASMLGVRREGITEAAGPLQQAGYISYRRGHITVLDRDGLEERVCECYGEVSAGRGWRHELTARDCKAPADEAGRSRRVRSVHGSRIAGLVGRVATA